ncbi:MAG: glycosyltransferase family 4 protein [Gallionella sp.]|nr:glycosyltransferase family 4 protein [Gallionella sp.]
MTYYSPLISALVALLLTLVLTLHKHRMIQDIPNERSLHVEPVPRTGGVALMAGILAGWMLLSQSWLWWIVVPVLGLFVLSLLDDVRGLTPGIRLIGHFLAASCVLLGAGISWIGWLPVLLYIVWMTNLYNFMDGSDGMAGGMALSGFTCYGLAGWMNGDLAFAMMSFSVGAAALGFLYHNFYPAKVFLGDAGSIPLGFLAAAFGVWGWQQGYWPFWFPVLVFSPFVMDATLTLLKRAHNKEKLTDAHRSHYYQRLVQMGWGHRNTAITEYALMLLAGVSALLGIGLDVWGQGGLLVCWAAIYLGLSIWIDRRWCLYQDANKESHDVA